GTALAVVLSSAACAGVLANNPPTTNLEISVPTAKVEMSVPTAKVEISAPTFAITFDRWYTDPPQVAQAAPLAGPSHVVINGANYQYQYVVDGEPQVIKGMGLNTQYAQQLSPAERARQLDADMVALQALGVNTVLGWDPAEFDD